MVQNPQELGLSPEDEAKIQQGGDVTVILDEGRGRVTVYKEKPLSLEFAELLMGNAGSPRTAELFAAALLGHVYGFNKKEE